MTFGESKRKFEINKHLRQWHLGNNVLDEVSHIMYLGNKLCAYNSTCERSKDMAKRAYVYLGSLKSVGFHSLGLSPITNGVLWQRLCLPSMLFSCETWGNLPKKEYDIFEKTQRTVAKYIQGVAKRTHNEIVLGLLGWHTIQGQIDEHKLKFVGKLVNMPATCITKKIFTSEIYHCILSSDESKTITSDFVRVLKKYNLYKYLLSYLRGGTFPDKLPWKYIVKAQVHMFEEIQWKINLRNKDANRYLRIQPKLNTNIVYTHIKSNLSLRSKLMSIVYMLTIVEEDEIMMCSECNNVLTNSVDHYIMRCNKFIIMRNKLWDDILDSMNAHAEVSF